MNEREIFAAALNMTPGGERDAYLDSACHDDRALRRRLNTLLQEHEGLGSFLELPAPGLPALDRDAIESSPAAGSSKGVLGDFQIIRELGQGGMGVVYEAEQISLSRRVALKVLPFSAVLDPRQLKRFKSEAQAAAGLHHTNIVPVYGVGCERGVHYYAMQYIEGQTIAEMIRDLRQMEGLQPSRDDRQRLATSELAESMASGQLFAGGQCVHASPHRSVALSEEGRQSGSNVSRAREGDTAKPVQAALSTQGGARTSVYYRNVARLGIQIAQALEHAHREGVVHRDVKPSNLIVDTRGNVWVTDFGLARVEADPGLTATGDILGTLRYMSPEQASGSHMLIDHRTDVYSLGATLYELLTLQPAFGDGDRQDLLRRINSDEPAPPRKLNTAVPADLETIVLKAMAKEPAERYPTAGELATDLGRFLEDVPIRARRPRLLLRATKWRRRHRTLVTTTGLAALVVVVVSITMLAVSNYRISRALEREQRTLYNHRIALANRELDENYVGLALGHLEACPPRLRDWEWYHLQWKSDRSLRTFEGHEHRVLDLCVSPDGKQIASGSWDGTVRVWDPETAKPLCVLPAQIDESGKLDFVWSVDYSPDGKRIAVGTRQAVRIWNLESSTIEREISTAVNREISDVKFRPDGQQLATVSLDSDTVELWDPSSGQRVRELRGHTDRVLEVTYSPDGRWLASASDDRTLRIWNTETGQHVRTLKGHEVGVACVAYSPNGHHIASGSWNGTICIWDAKEGRLELTIRGHAHSVDGIAFHPDGTRLVSACADSGCKMWDVHTGNELLALRGHRAPTGSVAFVAGGKWIVSGSWDGTLKLWDAMPKDPVRTFRGHQGWICGVVFSPDGQWFASCSRDDTIRVWNAATEHEEMTLTGHEDDVTSLAVSPDGRWLVSGSNDETVRIWEAGTGRCARTLPHPGRVNAVACTPDGKQIVSGCSDGLIRVWELSNGRLGTTLSGSSGGVTALACSPEGHRLASGNEDGTCRVWDLGSGRSLCTFRGHKGAVNSVTFSPDASLVVSCCMFNRDNRAGKIKFWDPRTGQELPVRLQTNPGPCSMVAFSPNGRRVVATTLNGYVNLFDPTSGEEVLAFHSHNGEVLCATFDREGRRIVSGGRDMVLHLWESSEP